MKNLIKYPIIWWCDLDPKFKQGIMGALLMWTIILSFFSKQLIQFIQQL